MASSSPRGAMSRLRRQNNVSNEATNDSTNTLSSNSDDPAADMSLHPTSSRNSSKLREKLRRKSVDDRPESRDTGKRLSALVVGRRNKAKRAVSSEDLRKQSLTTGLDNFALPGNQSSSSLGLDDSGRSSLLTDDDSDHGGSPVRPPLSTHPSHDGYLTLSAPDIQSHTHATTIDGSTAPDHITRSQSLPPTNIPEIIEPYDIEPLATPTTHQRSSTPVDKLKSAFGISLKRSSVDASSLASSNSGHDSIAGVPQSQEDSAEDPQSSQEQAQPVKRVGRPRVNTATRPETPPNLVETPTTYVTPPTPTDPTADAPTFARTAIQKASPSPTRSGSPPKSRRINLPSKLSQSVPAPLTPTVEETKTPGGTLSQPTNATGFFSSVFSAAQKAADSLSTSLNTATATSQKSRSISGQDLGEGGEEVIPGAQSRSVDEKGNGGKKQPAIDTLGSGDLNLSHLGIAESEGFSPMNSSTNLPMQNGAHYAEEEAQKKVEEAAAARAVSQAYQEPVHQAVKEAMVAGRPASIASTERLTLVGEQTPPRTGLDGEALKRSGSVRSRISGRRRRRRGTSATAGTAGSTIAAGLSAAVGGLGNLSVNGAGHRLTGFAVASNKRNKDFHQLFRSVPEDDYLIEDYSAALQRDILLHGRLYVSEGHICFASNILGWVTNLVISFDEVVSMEKKSTAVIFPNAIVISTLHARNTFASFVARDSTYELLIGIWKISHPNLKSSLNGVTLDNEGTGDRTEVADPEGSEGGSESGSEDEVYDEDADDDAGSLEETTLAPSIAGSEMGERTISRQPSGTIAAPSAAQANGGVLPKALEGADVAITAAGGNADFPGPATHEPTQCSESAEHYDRPLLDTTIAAPLGKIYSLVFGPASIAFMRKWHLEDQKSRECNFSDVPLDNEHKTITFDYIKPLNAPVGPKQTKCITTYTLLNFDLDKAVTVDCSTQTPDVPSGSVFSTKTRYCLMWGPDNTTRMIASCTIEWTGKSWLKGPIEKGANDGQIAFIQGLVAALKAAVMTRPPPKAVAGAKKGKRKGKKEISDADDSLAQRGPAVAAEQKASDWGIFEPIHFLLKPLSPFATSQTVIAVLFALLVYTWINPPSGRKGANLAYPGYTSPQRVAAYEELWRREESDLWAWLEDRAGLEGAHTPLVEGQRQKVLAARSMGKKVEDGKMNERHLADAIRVTEERLLALKESVAKKAEQRGGGKASTAGKKR